MEASHDIFLYIHVMAVHGNAYYDKTMHGPQKHLYKNTQSHLTFNIIFP